MSKEFKEEDDDNKIDILNPDKEFHVWHRMSARHLKVVEGRGKISEDDALLFSEDLEKHGCLLGDEIKEISENEVPRPAGHTLAEIKKKSAGRPRKVTPAEVTEADVTELTRVYANENSPHPGYQPLGEEHNEPYAKALELGEEGKEGGEHKE